MLPSSTQALLLALRLRGTALPNDRAIAKPKTGWHKESGRMEATATGTTTHIGGSTFFFRSGEEDKRIGCSQDKGGRIQSIAHSQPTRSGKEGVDYVSQFWMLIMITTCHFIKFLVASWVK